MTFILLVYSIHDLLCLSYMICIFRSFYFLFFYFFSFIIIFLFFILRTIQVFLFVPINTNVKCDKYKVRIHMYRITFNNVILKNT